MSAEEHQAALNYMNAHTVKKGCRFPLPPAGGRENREPFFTVQSILSSKSTTISAPYTINILAYLGIVLQWVACQRFPDVKGCTATHSFPHFHVHCHILL
jgi:hypothetical protein